MQPYQFGQPAFLATLCTLLLAMSSQSSDAAIIFSDDTFNPADWTTTTFFYDGAGPPGGVTTTQVTTGGNPGSFGSITNGVTNDGSVYGFHIRSLALYDPRTSGAIQSVDYSEDAEGISHGGGTLGYIQGTGIAFLQNGNLYRGTGFGVGYTDTPNTVGNWVHISFADLIAASFKQTAPDGTISLNQPDFSATGAPIEFGFVRANSGGDYSVTAGIDNWTVVVNPVPEPTSLSLIGFGGMGLLIRRRRNRCA